MSRHKVLVALSICASILIPSLGYVETPARLTTADYIAIEQLTAGYPYMIDHCTHGGYDYADQYTPDGIFGVSSAWGSKGKIWFRGREQLAQADGGGKGGCRPRPKGWAPVHHIVTSQVITPTAGGAIGRSTLLSLTDASDGNPPKIEWKGGYEDVYVKTAKGWKFKSRFHVWPGHQWPDTAAEQAALRAAAHKARRTR